MKVEFVPMTEQDIDWVVDQEAGLHHFAWSRGNFVDSLTAGHGCWLMHEAGQPVGYAVVLFVLDETHLLNIGVVRTAQGRGLGARLLEHLIGLAREGGMKQFFLDVRPSNLPALMLYQRTGFVELGRRKAYYPSANGREDAVVMRLEL